MEWSIIRRSDQMWPTGRNYFPKCTVDMRSNDTVVECGWHKCYKSLISVLFPVWHHVYKTYLLPQRGREASLSTRIDYLHQILDAWVPDSLINEYRWTLASA
eukprot:scaffold3073_cov66-Cylindrotheca_fusiformis.AAC.26